MGVKKSPKIAVKPTRTTAVCVLLINRNHFIFTSPIVVWNGHLLSLSWMKANCYIVKQTSLSIGFNADILITCYHLETGRLTGHQWLILHLHRLRSCAGWSPENKIGKNLTTQFYTNHNDHKTLLLQTKVVLLRILHHARLNQLDNKGSKSELIIM